MHMYNQSGRELLEVHLKPVMTLMADQTLARYVNERRILTLLRVQGPMSRADAARQLALTRGTITNLVESLISRELIIEQSSKPASGPRRELGRPGVNIALHRDGGYFLGAEIGVGVIRFALLDLTLEVVENSTIATAPDVPPEAAIKEVIRYAKSLMRRKKYRRRLRALGITVPGLVRSDGFVVNLPILGWKDVNLQVLAEAELGVPTSIVNNANAAAFGELYTQPSLQQDSVVYLKIGTGCGGAVIINGRLLRGPSGTAGELGHIRIASTGSVCSCGQVGCLETYVNTVALSRLHRPHDAPDVDALPSLPQLVATRAVEGDAAAQAAMDSIAHHLLIGLISLANVFGPRTIFLGGTMRPVLASCLDRLQQGVARGIVPGMEAPEVRLSALSELECAIGVATISHHQAFDISSVEIVSVA